MRRRLLSEHRSRFRQGSGSTRPSEEAELHLWKTEGSKGQGKEVWGAFREALGTK